MNQVPTLRAIRILLGLAVALLLIYGCGTENKDPEIVVPPPKTDPPTDTGTDTDFNGTYQLYNEFTGCLWQYLNFKILITQRGSQAVLTINGQDLTCQLIADELICNGTILNDGDRFNFQDFTLWHSNSGGLEGDSNYTLTFQSGNQCSGQLTMTSTLPGVGSIYLRNSTTTAFPFLGIGECGTNRFSPQSLRTPIAAGGFRYLRQIPTGCYDVAVCDNTDPVAEDCAIARNVAVKAATTEPLEIGTRSAGLTLSVTDLLGIESYEGPGNEADLNFSANPGRILSIESN